MIKFQHSQKVCSVLFRDTVAPIGIHTAPGSFWPKEKPGVAYARHHSIGASTKVRTALGRQICPTGIDRAPTSVRWERSGAASPQSGRIGAGRTSNLSQGETRDRSPLPDSLGSPLVSPGFSGMCGLVRRRPAHLYLRGLCADAVCGPSGGPGDGVKPTPLFSLPSISPILLARSIGCGETHELPRQCAVGRDQKRGR